MTTPKLEGRVVTLRVGTVRTQTWSGREIVTGAAKAPQSHPVLATAEGLAGDAQGNLTVHGGVDKAICCYPSEHYPTWRAEAVAVDDGGFFENLTLVGLTEEVVHLGDVFELGGAVVQVTQPRRPCTTVSARWERKDLPRLMQDRGRVGFYLRVLDEGPIGAGDAMRLRDRLPGSVSVAEVNRVMNVDRLDQDGISRLLASPELPVTWREKLERRRGGTAENDSARLGE